MFYTCLLEIAFLGLVLCFRLAYKKLPFGGCYHVLDSLIINRLFERCLRLAY